VVSLESGLAPLADAKIPFVDATKNEKGELLSNSDRIKRLEEIYLWLMKPEQTKRYNTLFIDSLSEIAELFFDVSEKKFKAAALASGKGYDPRQTYGELYSDFPRFVKFYRDMPHYDVVFSCLDNEREDKDTGINETMLLLPGRMRSSIPGLLEHVFYLDKKVDSAGVAHRKLLTDSTAKIFAKNRTTSDVNLQKYEEADLGKLINKLKGVKA
jgi:hypothetical protein